MESDRPVFELEKEKRELSTLEEMHAVLDEIDGEHQTYGALYVPAAGRLVAGGGQRGRWLVYFSPKDGYPEEFPTVVDKSLGDARVELIICGVASEFPAYKCVTEDKMRLAFEEFYTSGKLAEELQWESKLPSSRKKSQSKRSS